MKILSTLVAVLLFVAAAQEAFCQEPPLYNPYERPKHGPPLTNVFYKLEPSWLWVKLRDPKHHPSARMPDFQFTDDEVLDVMAYLKSIAREPLPTTQWPSWAAKGFDDLEDDEFDQMFELVDRGQAVWGNARCTICHTVNGPGEELIGGFVDLRVGGIDLHISAARLRRDWLYEWIKEPKNYFPDTLMPRFRLSDDELKGLVEYILRDDAFLPAEEEPESPDGWEALDEPERVSRGKRLIELSRCVVCHDAQGIPEVLRVAERPAPPPPGGFEFLAYDLRCLSCHAIQGRGGTYAPDLTGAGSRLHRPWIDQFVASPDMIRPLSQQMPKFNVTAKEASIIASYLSANRVDARIPTVIPDGAVTPAEIQSGRRTFQARGCFSCHTVGEGVGGGVGPSLDNAEERLRSGYIWYHLKDPHAVNPYSPEPDYGLSDEEARALGAYLSTRKP